MEQLEDRCVPSTFTVLNNSDTGVSGDGSLRGEIAAAAIGDTIVFDPSLSGQIITLAQPLSITQSLTIVGLGATQLAVSGNHSVPVFNIASGITVGISGLTIRDGTIHNNNGGGIFNQGTLTISSSTLSSNLADNGYGGGIYNLGGTLTVSNSILNGNSQATPGGGGGAIFNEYGTVTVVNTTLSGNSAIGGVSGGGGSGAAIFNNYGSVTVTNSTLAGNAAGNAGGGIFNNYGSVTVTNSTLSGNSANNNGGGGIFNAGTLTVANTTFTGNSGTAGGGILNIGGYTVSSVNSIIAKNTATFYGDPDVSGAFASQGHNLLGDGGIATGFTATGDQVGTSATPIDPNLGPLQDNGGPTHTMALLTGSPAIDAGDDSVLGPPLNLTTDQRGQPRLQGAHVDIGAFESAAIGRFSPTSLAWDDVRGGVNYTYQITGAAPTQETAIALYWSSSASFADHIGGPIAGTKQVISAGTPVGAYGPFHVGEGWLENVPDGAAYLLVVTDPDHKLGTFTEANNVLARANPLFVPFGQFTFNVEGNDNPNSPYYSRHIHWPTGKNSGVTIGRGYDMGQRNPDEVLQDLICAGVPPSQASAIAAGAGPRFQGESAHQFVLKYQAIIGDITREQQQALFNVDYQRYVESAEESYSKATNGVSGALPWNQLDLPIRVILVDFVYNSGPSSQATARAARAAMTNDYSKFVTYIELLPDNPPGRNKQRIAYLEQYE